MASVRRLNIAVAEVRHVTSATKKPETRKNVGILKCCEIPFTIG